MAAQKTEYTKFQKVMIVLIPIIVLLLIASIVMAFAITVLPLPGGFFRGTGNATVVMSFCSALLAIACIVFAIISASKEPDEGEMN